ncbi:ankyrin repeat domain-containing protein, partial [Escherichia coli]|nr:ankyrin repeat domain-containing protein [Escherichia coli]
MTPANDVLSKQISELAYKGQWEPLLNVLENYPSFINAASEKGYTPLHQAAWHGAKRPVIGKLLRMGADKTLATYNKLQTPLDIALEKNPSRKDLLYLLHPQPRTLSQLMRKMIEDQLIHFQTYDENMVLYERLLFLFNEYD